VNRISTRVSTRISTKPEAHLGGRVIGGLAVVDELNAAEEVGRHLVAVVA
jgi:hypothetical protein